jgi:hypothetical protein
MKKILAVFLVLGSLSSSAATLNASLEIGDNFTIKTKSQINLAYGSSHLKCGKIFISFDSAKMHRHIPVGKTYTFKLSNDLGCFDLTNTNDKSVLKKISNCLYPNSYNDFASVLNSCSLIEFVKTDPDYPKSIEVE